MSDTPTVSPSTSASIGKGSAAFDTSTAAPPHPPSSSASSTGSGGSGGGIREFCKEITIDAGHVQNTQLKLDSKDDTVQWEFKTKGYDIQFGLYYFIPPPSATGPATLNPLLSPTDPFRSFEMITVHALERLKNIDKVMAHGTFVAPKGGGTLRFVFDNKHSTFRSKTIVYKISVIGKSQNIAISAGTPVNTPYGSGVVESFRSSDEMYCVRLDWAKAYLNSSSVTPRDVSGGGSVGTAINERAIYGVDLFFNNRFHEAERFFQSDKQKYLTFAMSHAAIGFLQSVLMWEKEAMIESAKRIQETIDFSSCFLPSEGVGASLMSWGNWLVGNKPIPLTPVQLEASLICAECYNLAALLKLTDETFTGALKAGLNMRTSFQFYQKCWKQIEETTAEAAAASKDGKSSTAAAVATIDRSVMGGVQFGMGCFNAFNSVLPPIIVRVIEALGFPADRKKGLQQLNACLEGGGTRQSHHMSEGDRILTKMLTRYPDGALFWLMSGRLQRMKRSLSRSIADFEHAARNQKEWIQLQHICCYELGFCYFFSLNPFGAEQYWQRLYKENKWSKAFYAYQIALCWMEQNQPAFASAAPISSPTDPTAAATKVDAKDSSSFDTKLREMLQKVKPDRTYAGRVLDLEQFVIRRAADYLKGIKPSAALIEMVYLFYGFPQMMSGDLERALKMMDDKLKELEPLLSSPSAKSPKTDSEVEIGAHNEENQLLCRLLKAALLKALGRIAEAEPILRTLAEMPETLKYECWVTPFARFELGSLWMSVAFQKLTASSSANAATKRQSVSSPTTPPTTTTAAAGETKATVDPDVEALNDFEKAEKMFKKAKTYKTDFNFKYRLHLRVHLATQEVDLIKREITERLKKKGTLTSVVGGGSAAAEEEDASANVDMNAVNELYAKEGHKIQRAE